MKKGLLMLLAGVMAFGVSVQSLASARIDSMATDPRFVEDYDLIWMYPNKVVDYKGTVDFRLNAGPWSGTYPQNGGFGGGFGEWGGLLIDEEILGGVLGVYANRPNRLYTSAHAIAGNSGDAYRYYWGYTGGHVLGPVNPRNIIDLFYAPNLEDVTLGFRVNYGDDGVGGFTEKSVIGIAVGLGTKDFGPFNEANFHAGFELANVTYNSGAGFTDNGIYTAQLGALFSADAGNDTAIRVSGDVKLDQYDETDWDGEKINDVNVTLGLACNHKVNGGKGLISSGLLLYWEGGTYDDGTAQGFNNWAAIWNASLEASVNNWLTLRAGIQKPLVVRAYSEPSNYDEADFGEGTVIFTTGLGVTWQNFTLDGVINVATLESWLSGPNAGAGIFYPGTNGGDGQGIVALTEIDLKYKF
jgi:hypothetical protein